MLPKFADLNEQEFALVVPLLPAMATEIVKVIGLENALNLFIEFGGMNWVFAKSCPPAGIGAQRFEELAAVIGAENAIRLGATFPDEEIYIPRCIIAMNALRDRQIIKDFDELTKQISTRESYNQLARRYRCSSRAIERAVNGRVRPSRAKPRTETR